MGNTASGLQQSDVQLDITNRLSNLKATDAPILNTFSTPKMVYDQISQSLRPTQLEVSSLQSATFGEMQNTLKNYATLSEVNNKNSALKNYIGKEIGNLSKSNSSQFTNYQTEIQQNLGDYSSNMNGLQTEVKGLQQNINSVQESLGEYAFERDVPSNSAFNALGQKVLQNQTEIQKNLGNYASVGYVSNLQSAVQQHTAEIGGLQKNFASVQGSLGQYALSNAVPTNGAFNKMDQQLNQTGNLTKQNTTEIGGLNRNVASIQGSLGQYALTNAVPTNSAFSALGQQVSQNQSEIQKNLSNYTSQNGSVISNLQSSFANYTPVSKFNTLSENVGQYTTELNGLQRNVASIEDSLGQYALSNTVPTNSAFTALGQTQTEMQKKLQSGLNLANSNISNLQSSFANYTPVSKFNTFSENVGQHTNDISVLQKNVASVQGSLGQYAMANAVPSNAAFSALGQQVSQNQGDILKNLANYTSQSGSVISGLQSGLSSANSNLSTLQSSLANYTPISKFNTLSENVTSQQYFNSQQNNKNATEISNLNKNYASITTLNSNVSGLQSGLNAANSNIAGLQSGFSSLQSTFGNYAAINAVPSLTNFNTLGDSVSQLNQNLGNLQSNMGNFATKTELNGQAALVNQELVSIMPWVKSELSIINQKFGNYPTIGEVKTNFAPVAVAQQTVQLQNQLTTNFASLDNIHKVHDKQLSSLNTKTGLSQGQVSPSVAWPKLF